MIYVITNITHTSDDQHRRGHRLREFRKGRVQIGPKNILEGRSASFSEEMYQAHKARIDRYLEIGMIKMVAHGETVGEQVAVADVVEPQVVDVEAAVISEVEGVADQPTQVEEPAPEAEPQVEPEAVGAAAPTVEEPAQSAVESGAKRKGRPPREK